MKTLNTESRVNGIINLRALMLKSLDENHLSSKKNSTHANENNRLFTNRLLYKVHFPSK